MGGERVVQLRSGLGARGGGERDAVLRSMTGADEALFAQLAADLPPAHATTELLSCAIERIGALSPVSTEDARELTVGDRHRLLLALYRATHGRRLSLVVPCLAPGCGRILELDLSLDRILDEPIPEGVALEHEIRVDLAGREVQVRFRLPNGGDQEAVSAIAATDVDQAADLVLRRTVLLFAPSVGEGDELEACLPALRAPLTAAFARLDPEAEIVLRLACPDCGHETPADLDPFALFEGRVQNGRDIYAEVDRIARTYHWSEADILALTIARRRRYLALIDAGGSP
jgi:hypothetical protein